MLTEEQREQIEETFKDNADYHERDFLGGMFTTLCHIGEREFAVYLKKRYLDKD